MIVSDLQQELDSLDPKPTPSPELPIAHLTTSQWFESILDIGRIEPRVCKFLREDLVYFSYGGVFYRPSSMQTENVIDLPVAMVFSPEVLDVCYKLFPFDSGAMAERLYGDKWSNSMHPFESRFVIEGTDLSRYAGELVTTFYSGNAEYLRGNPTKVFGRTEPTLSLLHEFLNDDLSGIAVDHRQRSIEVLCKSPVEIGQHLIWIGLPNFALHEIFQRLKQYTRRLPAYYPYEYSKNFSPQVLAGHLQQEAERMALASYKL